MGLSPLMCSDGKYYTRDFEDALSEEVPDFTGDLNILLGEFAEWLGKYDMRICVEQGYGRSFTVYLFGLGAGCDMVKAENFNTPQEAAEAAVRRAMPRIKEIVKGE